MFFKKLFNNNHIIVFSHHFHRLGCHCEEASHRKLAKQMCVANSSSIRTKGRFSNGSSEGLNF